MVGVLTCFTFLLDFFIGYEVRKEIMKGLFPSQIDFLWNIVQEHAWETVFMGLPIFPEDLHKHSLGYFSFKWTWKGCILNACIVLLCADISDFVWPYTGYAIFVLCHWSSRKLSLWFRAFLLHVHVWNNTYFLFNFLRVFLFSFKKKEKVWRTHLN